MGLRLLLVAACFTSLAHALALSGGGAVRAPMAAASRAAPVAMQFGKKQLSPEEKLEAMGYWPGEWCCSDCGYFYEPGTVPPFEELRQKWKCPQCAGPRRRFVKKAGGQYGSIDDSPLFIGMGLSVAFIVFAVYIGLTV